MILVGSSNLTRPAYGENIHNWNFECDILLWESNTNLDNHFNSSIAELTEEPGIISATVDHDIKQPSINEQMMKLYQDLKTEMTDFEKL